MKTKLLLLFFVITFLLPLLVFVVIGLLDVQHPLLRYGVCIILSFCSVVGFILYMIKKKSSKWYLFFLIATLSLLIEILPSPLRGYAGFQTCSIVVFILYFLFVNIALKQSAGRLKGVNVLYSCLIGIAVIQIPIRIFSFLNTLVSLPDFLFHLLGIILGYLFYYAKKSWKIIILMFSLLSNIFLYFKGYDMWLHKVNFGTFTGKIESKQIYDFKVETSIGDTLSLSDFKGKYLLIDCWYTYCGVCYQKMPEVQKLYDIYKENNVVIINSMHCYIKENEDYTTGSEILKKRHYTFPCLAVDMEDPILKELGVNVYPTVLIFDKQSNLIFRGDIENARNFIRKQLEINASHIQKELEINERRD